MQHWLNHIEQIHSNLQAMTVSGADGLAQKVPLAYARWVDLTLRVRQDARTIFLIGNGASASMASHVAADLAKNAKIRTEVFSDLSLITAIANDVSYDEVFAEPLRRRMCPGDMLVAISSSGRSRNILRAADEAKRIQGSVVTLSAMHPDNPLCEKGALNFYVPCPTYGLAETCHAAILHYWIDQVVMSQK